MENIDHAALTASNKYDVIQSEQNTSQSDSHLEKGEGYQPNNKLDPLVDDAGATKGLMNEKKIAIKESSSVSCAKWTARTVVFVFLLVIAAFVYELTAISAEVHPITASIQFSGPDIQVSSSLKTVSTAYLTAFQVISVVAIMSPTQVWLARVT